MSNQLTENTIDTPQTITNGEWIKERMLVCKEASEKLVGYRARMSKSENKITQKEPSIND
ncbi:MAG: hypothetical protein A2511_13935 [Deltaproteobacteria bacterium RIFOXYD12_FULL_50_9]|nr:MAG: hypothetical protein A2511_13935 [Deltaproteobacteria bacterium RIFOXYD12_FULL_50_9]